MGEVKFTDNAGAILAVDVGIGDSEFKISQASGTKFPEILASSSDWMYITIGSDHHKVSSAVDDGSHFVFTLYGGATFSDAYGIGTLVQLLVISDLLTDIRDSMSYGDNLFINPNGAVNQEGYVNGELIPDLGGGTSNKNLWDMWRAVTVGASASASVVGGEITLTNVRIRQMNDDLINLSRGVDIFLTVSVQSGSVYFADGDDEGATVTPATPFTFTYNSGNNGYLYFGLDSQVYQYSGLKVELGQFVTTRKAVGITEEWLECYRYVNVLDDVIAYPMSASVSVHNTSELRISFASPVVMADNLTVTARLLTIIGGGHERSYNNISGLVVASRQGNVVDVLMDLITPIDDFVGHSLSLRKDDSIDGGHFTFDARY